MGCLPFKSAQGEETIPVRSGNNAASSRAPLAPSSSFRRLESTGEPSTRAQTPSDSTSVTDKKKSARASVNSKKPFKETTTVKLDTTDEGNKTINQYVVIGKLGSGAYSKVKLCMNTEDNALYAMKVCHRSMLRKKRIGASTALDDVMREISIMKQLNHPNVVRLFEVIDDPEDDRLFLILEHLEGGSVMKRTLDPIPEKQAHKYFCDILAGLEYLHGAHVIHRDIKPENLLVAADGAVKISDFGVSYLFPDDDDSLKQSAGSPAFLAPELCAAGTTPHGKLVDIWALGVTLYCFIFGQVPFMAENVLDIYEKIRNAPLTYPHSVNPDLQDLLSRILEKDPSKRITMDQLKKHPWVIGSPSQASTTNVALS